MPRSSRPSLVASKSSPPDAYEAWLGELKNRIASARVAAARRINTELVHLYWDIGQSIVEKQAAEGWGSSVVAQLARDLRRAFPDARGFSAPNLWRMQQFFLTHTHPAFLSQAVRELGRKGAEALSAQKLAQAVRELVAGIPWGHHANVLAKLTDPAARFYYLRAAAAFGWTRAVLLNQVKARAYERTLAEGKTHNFPATLPASLAAQAEESLKSSYSLEFLGIHREVRERELEDQLISQVQRFILELGYGFCFVGRQHRLMLGAREYFVDLLFYHRFLKALVAIDLKIGGFEPEFAGKMDFYLNLLNDRERARDDRPSIGIILCAEKDNLEVEFALKTKGNPIGVAAYELKPTLPAEFRGKLPTGRQLAAALRLPPS